MFDFGAAPALPHVGRNVPRKHDARRVCGGGASQAGIFSALGGGCPGLGGEGGRPVGGILGGECYAHVGKGRVQIAEEPLRVV